MECVCHTERLQQRWLRKLRDFWPQGLFVRGHLRTAACHPVLIGVIMGDEEGRGRKPPPDRYQTSRAKQVTDIDAMTLWRIERMLKVGWLEHEQVAREAGVPRNVVSEVAQGRRPLVVMRHRKMPKGQMPSA